MDLPHTNVNQEYTDEVKVIESNLRDISSGTAPRELYDYAQNKLDKLAERFQDNEQLGKARYKLYELQALLYYYQNRDVDSLKFIQRAIETKGASYTRAERLIEQLQTSPSLNPDIVEHTRDEVYLTKEEKRERVMAVEGWLAWFMVGLFITGAMTLYNLFKGELNLSSTTIDSLNQFKFGFGDKLNTLIIFENVALVVYILLLVASIILLLRKSKLAKIIVITLLAFGVIYSIADYSAISSLSESYGITQNLQPYLNIASSNASRFTLGAIIWIPYFLVSKRVKATLTK